VPLLGLVIEALPPHPRLLKSSPIFEVTVDIARQVMLAREQDRIMSKAGYRENKEH
jgi:hypothetical protein